MWDASRGTLLASAAELDLRLLRGLRADQPLPAQIEHIRALLPTGEQDVTAPDPTGHYDIRYSHHSADSNLMVRSLETGAVVRQIPLDSREAVAVSPDGRRLAYRGRDNVVLLCAAGTGDEPLELKGHLGAVKALSFSTDGSRLASGSEDGTVRLWDVQSGAEALTLHGHQGAVCALAFSPDGRYIASGSEDTTVRIWDSGAAR